MRFQKYIIFNILFCLTLISATGQEHYWIFFTDKHGTSFEPYSYFDVKAIERRNNNCIPLYDSTDYPLNESYVKTVSEYVQEITTHSRWFNAVAVIAYENQIAHISKLDFIKEIYPVYLQTIITGHKFDTAISVSKQWLLNNQTERMGGNLFKDKGIDGKGIRIAIFDGGFPNVDTHPAFEHIRKQGRIIKTWDFASDKENVYGNMSHGTMVMSCIGGKINEKRIGLATGAEFLLAKTEVMFEPFSEEENWLAAAEWADKNGADIINSSLGYTYNRYFQEQMDGKTSLVARAANMAAKKGILVVNAVGNDGQQRWQYAGTPADADSVLSVGGIEPQTDYHTSFSSYGPTADFRLKPNVCAYGHVIAASKKGLTKTQGTSFASPLTAGFAACAWQTNRQLSNMELFREIEKSGDLYPYFDYAHGYGVPQASYFLDMKQNSQDTTFTLSFINDTAIIKLKEPPKIDSHDYIYYHFENKEGILIKYAVIHPQGKDTIPVYIDKHYTDYILRIFYKGF
ncbi:MAG: S8 family serine peptidase, partial [Bacteroidia bacterium]|nr:S8 family serine peptidase [Bacteroidia bacterium]